VRVRPAAPALRLLRRPPPRCRPLHPMRVAARRTMLCRATALGALPVCARSILIAVRLLGIKPVPMKHAARVPRRAPAPQCRPLRQHPRRPDRSRQPLRYQRRAATVARHTMGRTAAIARVQLASAPAILTAVTRPGISCARLKRQARVWRFARAARRLPKRRLAHLPACRPRRRRRTVERAARRTAVRPVTT
jgi:hypothetical protein